MRRHSNASQDMEKHGTARSPAKHGARNAMHGSARHGYWRREARRGLATHSLARPGTCKACHGPATHGSARQGTVNGKAGLGIARHGIERQDAARHGYWRGTACQGRAYRSVATHSMVIGEAQQIDAKHGTCTVRPGLTWPGKARINGVALRSEALRGEARQSMDYWRGLAQYGSERHR